MWLQHSLKRIGVSLFFLLALVLAGCTPPRVTQGVITVNVAADGESQTVEAPAGSTAADALTAAGIVAGDLDRSEPPFYTLLKDGSSVRLIRVREEYAIEQVVIPFERQFVPSETLPEGEENWVYLQDGKNGLQEITYRRVFEDGVEVSSDQLNPVILRTATPEIIMYGIRAPFAPLEIPGRLVYLLDGDGWVMEGTTASRRAVVTTGDLDGRVFSLSPDGNWLLFTRRAEADDSLNTLWAAALDGDALIDLKVANVIHFADWKPGSKLTVVYSTVEPRLAAPRWLANNDLWLRSFSASGFLNPAHGILEANPGGLYGWWGTHFGWAPDGLSLAYARPDGLGVLDTQTGEQTQILEITPLQTFGDWAWVPGFTWGPDGKTIYTATHLPPAESRQFDLVAIPLSTNTPLILAHDVGMFANPVPSPLTALPSGENAYQIAYLQALLPSQGERSTYRLMVMDRDGSNRRSLFPQEGAGLGAQQVVWSPAPLEGRASYSLALLYEKNLWLVDSVTGKEQQITGDGLITNIDWK